MSIVRIREGPYYRGFFLKKLYENFVGTSEIVRKRGGRIGGVSVRRGSIVHVAVAEPPERGKMCKRITIGFCFIFGQESDASFKPITKQCRKRYTKI